MGTYAKTTPFWGHHFLNIFRRMIPPPIHYKLYSHHKNHFISNHFCMVGYNDLYLKCTFCLGSSIIKVTGVMKPTSELDFRKPFMFSFILTLKCSSLWLQLTSIFIINESLNSIELMPLWNVKRSMSAQHEFPKPKMINQICLLSLPRRYSTSLRNSDLPMFTIYI